MELNQYDIVLVNLEPTQGREIRKTRPCLVVSPREMNAWLRTIVVVPMTTAKRDYPTRLKLKHDNKIGYAAIDQIRTIDQGRVIKVLGRINRKEIQRCKSIIHETFVA